MLKVRIFFAMSGLAILCSNATMAAVPCDPAGDSDYGVVTFHKTDRIGVHLKYQDYALRLYNDSLGPNNPIFDDSDDIDHARGHMDVLREITDDLTPIGETETSTVIHIDTLIKGIDQNGARGPYRSSLEFGYYDKNDSFTPTKLITPNGTIMGNRFACQKITITRR